MKVKSCNFFTFFQLLLNSRLWSNTVQTFERRSPLKVLLVQPPVEDFYTTDIRLQPIGLGYLKSALKKAFPSISVKIIDFQAGRGRATIPIPEDLSDLAEYYRYADKSPFSVFHAYFHFGASWDEIEETIRKEEPDLVGISCLFSPYFKEALRVAQIVKDQSSAITVLGGGHTIAAAETFLQSQFVDHVVQGEAEEVFVELVDDLIKQRPADKLIASKSKPDVHNLAWPDMSDLDAENYKLDGQKLAMLITSRGCPFRCEFCSIPSIFGTKFRQRNPRDVVNEMKWRFEQGIRVFDFEDDNLTYRKEFIIELCSLIKKELPVEQIRLVAMNGISYQTLDEDILVAMKSAGFSEINLSLVSSDTRLKDQVNRPHSVEKFQKTCKQAQQLGLKVTAYQILGLPTENIDQMVATLKVLSELPVLIGASPFYATPGCPMALSVVPQPTEKDIVRSRLTTLAIETEKFNRDEIFTLFVTTRIINFAKALIDKSTFDSQDLLGLSILRELFENKKLVVSTKKGQFEHKRFQPNLFFRATNELNSITARSGRGLPSLRGVLSLNP
jgi:radical SAM superfamily enzyme YgiQ (UPF0313 family)